MKDLLGEEKLYHDLENALKEPKYDIKLINTSNKSEYNKNSSLTKSLKKSRKGIRIIGTPNYIPPEIILGKSINN